MASLRYVPGEIVYADTVYLPPKIFIVGEAPGQAEEEQLRPFVGRSGQYLRGVLKDLGVNCYYLTNAVKVRPEGNRRPTKPEIETWASTLEQELINCKSDMHPLDPEPLIIALGESADWAIKCLDENFRHHKLWHPSYVVRFGKDENFRNNFKVLLEKSRLDY